MDDDPPLKRKYPDSDNGAKKAPRLGGSSNAGGGGATAGGGKMSFAQRMMAKMGYQEGQGLGREGEGMVNPIEVKLRPQGAGVGAIKERTKQYKEEKKRQAERRGEEFEDSSEEEKRARRERRKKKAEGGASTPVGGDSRSGASAGTGRKSKTRFRTLEDVAAAAPGLDVPPQMLSSILDATGAESKMLTSAAGLMTPTGFAAPESEADKIAKREKLELEAFIEAWHGVQEQKIYIEQHEGQLQVEIEQRLDELEKLREITEAVESLQLDIKKQTMGTAESSSWDMLIDKLENIQTNFRHDLDRNGISDVSVGALVPLFKEQMADWEPLEEPTRMTNGLDRIRVMLGLEARDELTTTRDPGSLDESYGKSKRKKATSAYETLMYTVWLPRLRTTVTNWNVLEYKPMVEIVKAWRPLLPAFVYSNLIDQLVVPKLSAGLQTWDPRKRAHHHRHESLKHAQPHTWIFPWLPYLPAYQLDPKAPDGLIVEFKRRLRHVLDGWDVSAGSLPGLEAWRDILRSELDHVLIRHLLPRLALHLSSRFLVDPSDQDMAPFHAVFAWKEFFKTDVLARLMVAEFFPKLLQSLHTWLMTEDAELSQIGQWSAWWKEQLPEKITAHADVEQEWKKVDNMIKDALRLYEQGLPLSKLLPPAAGPSRPIAKEVSKKLDTASSIGNPPSSKARIAEPDDLRGIVESWCAEEDLTMVPLREAHPTNGLPLFRITASATGKGGVIVYLQGDLIWAQRKGERSSYDPIGLDENLVARAEGR